MRRRTIKRTKEKEIENHSLLFFADHSSETLLLLSGKGSLTIESVPVSWVNVTLNANKNGIIVICNQNVSKEVRTTILVVSDAIKEYRISVSQYGVIEWQYPNISASGANLTVRNTFNCPAGVSFTVSSSLSGVDINPDAATGTQEVVFTLPSATTARTITITAHVGTSNYTFIINQALTATFRWIPNDINLQFNTPTTISWESTAPFVINAPGQKGYGSNIGNNGYDILSLTPNLVVTPNDNNDFYPSDGNYTSGTVTILSDGRYEDGSYIRTIESGTGSATGFSLLAIQVDDYTDFNMTFNGFSIFNNTRYIYSPILDIEYEEITIPAAGLVFDFAVKSNGVWSAISSDDWIRVSQTTNTGDTSITITVIPNTSGMLANGFVEFNTIQTNQQNKTEILIIKQEA